MGLDWVPRFETGIPVSLEELPLVIEELENLRGWMGSQPGYAYDLERLSTLIEELSRLRNDQGVEVFIG